MIPSKSLGNSGEEAAASFLKKKGFKILERNLRFSLGEIDIVALDGETHVIVEVKTLTNVGGFSPQDHFDARKQKKLLALGDAYLARARKPISLRFDLIAITSHDGRYEIDHFPDVLQDGDQ